jgi:adenosylmethionine---8-amino-7-oxononanoate aminotransferase
MMEIPNDITINRGIGFPFIKPTSPQMHLSTEELLRLDRQHVWHPYAVAGPGIEGSVVPIESANGVLLRVRKGSSYDRSNYESEPPHDIVDGMSNWWASIHGHNHPTLNEAIIHQVEKMSHVMFGGITHEPGVQLCTKLCQLTMLDVCFLCDSGSVAVEVAMKMALQYWNGRYRSHPSAEGVNRKTKFVTVRNGYHGDTFAAMSVCDPVNGMHTQFSGGILQQHYFVPAPTPIFPGSSLSSSVHEEDFDETIHIQELKSTLERHHETIAAMIIEPIVQGAGGMRMYHPKYLQRARELCTKYDVLFIVDEIATGFGRTNEWFAHMHCEYGSAYTRPDIVCLGKALTGGYMSLAATLTTSHVAEVIHEVSGDPGNRPSAVKPVLMHGPTFMGNPLASSVALASITLLEQSQLRLSSTTRQGGEHRAHTLPAPQNTRTCTDWRRSVPMIEQQLRNELMECTESTFVRDVRVMGAIGVVEMKDPIKNMKEIQHSLVKDYGVWLRPFGKLIYTMPPFVITPDQLRKITTAMVQLTRRRF